VIAARDPGNRVIAALSREDADELMRHASQQELVLWQRVPQDDAVYFPVRGCISLLADMDGAMGPEVDMVGADGMLGWHAVLGHARPAWHALVSSEGRAWRIDADRLRNMRLRSESLRLQSDHQLYLALARMASAAACLRLHAIEQRLARRLLMHHDCTGDTHMRATHASLASLLGVRRVGVTRAAGALSRLGLITYRHGVLQIQDRVGLTDLACSCYVAHRALHRIVAGH